MFQNFCLEPQETIILILGVIVVLCLIEIFDLKKLLIKEKKKRLIPLVNLEIDTTDANLYLKNHGDGPVTNITFEVCQVTLEYEFKKELTLKIERVPMLLPGQRYKLQFQVFEKDYNITPSVKRSFATNLLNSSFSLPLYCTNMEGIPFRVIIVKEKNRFSIQEVKPVEKIGRIRR